jgi:quercetin 2,3-dioxygenase
MDRKNFIKKSLLGAGGLLAATQAISANQAPKSEEPIIEPVGFNHLPNTQSLIMKKTVIHKANSRGNANHGWLDSKHTFSFANYYNPERMNFGVLRVLNDDTVAPGMGFNTHPHDNMEIISIPLEGDLEHKDSMGNVAVIKNGDVQVMSAGTGIKHSEFNKNKDLPVKFLQIWVYPDKHNVEPRYDQITLNQIDRKNRFQQILSPSSKDQGVWIHQQAWFHLSDMDAGKKLSYTLNKQGNGVYVFVLKGRIEIEGITLEDRDGFGIWDINQIDIEANADTSLLLMEVPMKLS